MNEQLHPQSFDGRYFGTIDKKFIMGEVAPVWLCSFFSW
jgi:type IV secretory pathway protease TraF